MPALACDPLREICPANRDRIYAELRRRMPVYKSSVFASWVLTRYADICTILRHPDALASELVPFFRSLSQRGKMDLSSLIKVCSAISFFMRPPGHDAVRRMLTRSLAGIWRMNLPELLERRADQLLASGQRDGAIDLAGGYGRQLALFVIGTFLGIPEEDLPKLSALARDLMAVFERIVLSKSTVVYLDKRAATLMDYFVRLIASRRRSGGGDGASLMVRLADEHLGCSDEELAGYCTFFFMAAEETTTAAISGAALILLQRPPLCAQLSSNLSLLPYAAREMLRLVSPVQFVSRELRVDVNFEGQLVRAGERIVLMLGAANRDPEAFPNPDEPVLDRTGPEPIAFAVGPYRCIGAQLAIFEVEVAIKKLLERPNIQLSSHSPIWINRMNVAPLLELQACFA